MSDLREAIATDIRVAIYRVSTKHGIEQTDLFVDAVAKIASDAVLDVVTAHLTVTDADAEWYVKFFTENHLEWPYWARVKAALEAFVARKLKGEPK